MRTIFPSFFFSSRRRHTRFKCDWSSDVCSSDLCAALGLPLAAQQRQGPLPPPPPGTVAPSSAPAEAAKPNASRQETSSHITNEPPPVPVQQIIQKFTEHEEEFRKERDDFTYTQSFEFQELDEDGRPDGEYS